MKFIFLDFDGVLNSKDFLDDKEHYSHPSHAEGTHINPFNVQLINELVSKTGAEVVVSSTWRLSYSIDKLNEMLKSKGATFKIIGKTPDLSKVSSGWGGYASRGNEIQDYLDSLDLSPESFIIIDDIDNMAHLSHRLVLTDYDDNGFNEKDLKKALEMFGLN